MKQPGTVYTLAPGVLVWGILFSSMGRLHERCNADMGDDWGEAKEKDGILGVFRDRFAIHCPVRFQPHDGMYE